jgi:magnesium-transporting ATPase (P-type)
MEAILVYYTSLNSQILLAGNQDSALQAGLSFVGYFILLNTMIPISLIVSIDVIKSIQGYLISHDDLMSLKKDDDLIRSRTFRSTLN